MYRLFINVSVQNYLSPVFSLRLFHTGQIFI